MNKKVAVVTGASRGIGKSVAEYLAEAGYHVILLARNVETLQQVCKSILAKSGKCDYFAIDVSNSEQVQSCVQNVITTHGQIDLLFNNAGVLKHGTSGLSAKNIEELLQINLKGAIYIASCIATQMKKQGNGYIINLSSVGGKIAQSFAGLYAASKFGLAGYSEALAKEMAQYNVKVTCICPGPVATDMTAGRHFAQEDMIAPDDINKTLSYLLSLGKNAIPFEIVINCAPLVKKMSQAMHGVYGIAESD